MNVGDSKQLGPYVVRVVIRHDNPAFPKHLIFRGERLIGAQFSEPIESDCRWLERHLGVYATAEQSFKYSSARWLRGAARRSRSLRELEESAL